MEEQDLASLWKSKIRPKQDRLMTFELDYFYVSAAFFHRYRGLQWSDMPLQFTLETTALLEEQFFECVLCFPLIFDIT